MWGGEWGSSGLDSACGGTRSGRILQAYHYAFKKKDSTGSRVARAGSQRFTGIYREQGRLDVHKQSPPLIHGRSQPCPCHGACLEAQHRWILTGFQTRESASVSVLGLPAARLQRRVPILPLQRAGWPAGSYRTRNHRGGVPDTTSRRARGQWSRVFPEHFHASVSGWRVGGVYLP